MDEPSRVRHEVAAELDGGGAGIAVKLTKYTAGIPEAGCEDASFQYRTRLATKRGDNSVRKAALQTGKNGRAVVSKAEG